MNEPDNQNENSKPWLWKKGQSGNPAGRPRGKTMKEYARDLLDCQTEEERQAFLHGLPKEIIWKMAEGNPSEHSKVELSGEVKHDVEIKELAVRMAKEIRDELKGKTE